MEENDRPRSYDANNTMPFVEGQTNRNNPKQMPSKKKKTKYFLIT